VTAVGRGMSAESVGCGTPSEPVIEARSSALGRIAVVAALLCSVPTVVAPRPTTASSRRFVSLDALGDGFSEVLVRAHHRRRHPSLRLRGETVRVVAAVGDGDLVQVTGTYRAAGLPPTF